MGGPPLSAASNIGGLAQRWPRARLWLTTCGDCERLVLLSVLPIDGRLNRKLLGTEAVPNTDTAADVLWFCRACFVRAIA